MNKFLSWNYYRENNTLKINKLNFNVVIILQNSDITETI